MSLHRHAARRDKTERPGIKALLALPCVLGVETLSARGWPDTAVWVRGAGLLFIEWKSPGGKLTAEQVKWWLAHEASGATNAVVVDSTTQAVDAVEEFRAYPGDVAALRLWNWRRFAPPGTPAPSVVRR